MSRLKHPINSIREPFGTAGLIVAMVALIAALGGSALAANSALSGKQKKEVEKIAKKYAGKSGAAGVEGKQGPEGKQGAKGDTGAKGSTGNNGNNGNAGESVTVQALSPGNGSGHCEEGGTELTNASATSYACNGEEGTPGSPGAPGSPWTAGGTLPVNSTETGVWAASVPPHAEAESLSVVTAISFPIKLASALESSHVKRVKESEVGSVTGCPGSVANPTAQSGYLCIYWGASATLFASNVTGPANPATNAGGANVGGATFTTLFLGTTPTNVYASGTWAVTG